MREKAWEEGGEILLKISYFCWLCFLIKPEIWWGLWGCVNLFVRDTLIPRKISNNLVNYQVFLQLN